MLAVLALVLVVELDVGGRLSVTFDEPAHIGAGFAQAVRGEVLLNREHPPLVKLLSGLFLRGVGVREGSAADVYERARAEPATLGFAQWRYGERLLVGDNPPFRFGTNRPGLDSVVAAARLPVVVFPLLLVLVAWAFARDLFGRAGGLLALALVATSPEVLGHGALVTDDVAVSALALAAGFTFRRLATRGGAGWLLLLGAALGGALGAKYSGALIVPALLVATAGFVRARRDPALATALHPFGQGDPRRRALALAGAVAIAALVALAVLSALYLGEEPVSAWLRGMREVHQGVPADYETLCLGRYAPRFWSYFVVAFLLKTPVGTLAVLVAAALAALRRRQLAAEDELLLGLPAALFFVAATAFAVQVGVRYVLPGVAYLLVSAARAAREATPRTRALLACALVANLVGLARGHPFHTSATNLLAGPPVWFNHLLDDSNQDWGQGLEALADWQRERGITDLVVIAHDASIAESFPAEYGVGGEAPRGDLAQLFEPRLGCFYAVSAHLVARARLLARANHVELVLGDRISPSELVGGGFLIFDLTVR